jgi:cell division protein FtsB
MMTQRFLGSVVAAALLTTSAFANDTLMQRFEKMEKEMASLKAELNAIKAENSKLSTQLSSPSKLLKKEVASVEK